VTVTDCPASPPVPLQVKINVLFAVRELRVSLPEVFFVPAQSPEATHELASVDDQAKVVSPL
jgi:hypothetical protein